MFSQTKTVGRRPKILRTFAAYAKAQGVISLASRYPLTDCNKTDYL
jgi:hypothetical protein